MDILNDRWRSELLPYLKNIYSGVFTEQAIEAHLENHAGDAFATYACALVTSIAPRGARLLDIGSGFGSFVLLAREAGFDAKGIEPATWQVDFAQRRLATLRPQDDPAAIFYASDAEGLQGSGETFDVVTLWNVLEHIPKTGHILEIVSTLLRPEGQIFIICPNYFSWRQEAHYHLPWSPLDLLNRSRFAKRLRHAGRNPAYFLEGIVPVTNWGILSMLHRLGFSLTDFAGQSMAPRPTLRPTLLARRLRFWNPLAPSLEVVARKTSGKV